MGSRFKLGVATTVLAAVFLLIPGCDHKKDEAGPAGDGIQKTSITLDWKPEPEFGGFYAAKVRGAFAAHKLDVDLKSAGEGAPTWQLVDTGKAEFATTAADQVLIARSKNADVVAIFAVYQTSPQGIMVHAARGFKEIGDVFTHEGTLAVEDNAWVRFLKGKYPSPAVKLTTYSGGVTGFLASPQYSQQCFVTSEPLEAKRKGSDPQTFLVADAGYNPYTTVVITRGETLRKQPEKVKAMVAACREGWREYLDDPAPVNAEMMKLNKDMEGPTWTEAAAAQKPLIETTDTKANGLGSMTLERWKALSQQLVDLKVLEKAPPPEECFAKL